MSAKDTALLFVLAGLFGAAFLFIRIVVPVLGPFPLVAIRVFVGGFILLLYATLIHQAPDWRTQWRRFLLIGLFNNAIPFTLTAAAELNLTASLAALLNATMPLFSAIIAAIWIKDRLSLSKLVGLFLGIIGVSVIVGWQNELLDSSRIGSMVLVLGASFSYGVAVVYGKVAFKGTHPVSTSTGQLLSAGVMILPFALLNPPTQPIQPTTVIAMLGLSTLSTAVSFLIYFHLIDSAGPTNAASVTLLVPFFSSLWGAIFLGEQLHWNEIVGFGIILVGLLLVTGLWNQWIEQRQLASSET